MTAPGYLPAIAQPLLPWARRHVTRVAKRYHTGIDDLWDETITALLRASIHYEQAKSIPRPIDAIRGPAATARGAFKGYAQTAVHRACWRYVCRKIVSDGQPLLLSLDDEIVHTRHPGAPGYEKGPYRSGGQQLDLDTDLELAWASAEEEVMAREAVWLRSGTALPPSALAPVAPDPAVHARARSARDLTASDCARSVPVPGARAGARASRRAG